MIRLKSCATLNHNVLGHLGIDMNILEDVSVNMGGFVGGMILDALLSIVECILVQKLSLEIKKIA